MLITIILLILAIQFFKQSKWLLRRHHQIPLELEKELILILMTQVYHLQQKYFMMPDHQIIENKMLIKRMNIIKT